MRYLLTVWKLLKASFLVWMAASGLLGALFFWLARSYDNLGHLLLLCYFAFIFFLLWLHRGSRGPSGSRERNRAILRSLPDEACVFVAMFAMMVGSFGPGLSLVSSNQVAVQVALLLRLVAFFLGSEGLALFLTRLPARDASFAAARGLVRGAFIAAVASALVSLLLLIGTILRLSNPGFLALGGLSAETLDRVADVLLGLGFRCPWIFLGLFLTEGILQKIARSKSALESSSARQA
jgi:hypothetical protein